MRGKPGWRPSAGETAMQQAARCGRRRRASPRPGFVTQRSNWSRRLQLTRPVESLAENASSISQECSGEPGGTSHLLWRRARAGGRCWPRVQELTPGRGRSGRRDRSAVTASWPRPRLLTNSGMYMQGSATRQVTDRLNLSASRTHGRTVLGLRGFYFANGYCLTSPCGLNTNFLETPLSKSL